MRCVFLGDKVGDIVKACCGGGEQLTPVSACLCTECRAGFTSGNVITDSFVTLRLHGKPDSIRKVPSCARCEFREEPIQLPRVTATGPGDKSATLARQIWEERRAKRQWSPTQKRSVVLNCDTHGYGDATIACWLAEGTKRDNPRILLHATGAKREFCEMLGQSVVPSSDANSHLAEGFAADKQLQGHPPRVYAWLASYGIEGRFSRPQHNLTDAERLQGESIADRNTVLIFPQSAQRGREWPAPYWFDLVDVLKLAGRSVVAMGTPDGRFATLAGKMLIRLTWRQVAAAMLASGLVIGNDSAPCHLAGTLDVPALAMLGPTTDGVFSHARSVRCLSVERRVLECVGCWWGWGHTPECEQTCAALANLQPAEVGARAIAIMREGWHAHAAP